MSRTRTTAGRPRRRPVLEPLERRLNLSTYTWNGSDSSDWSDNANWSPTPPAGGIPSGSDLVFPASAAGDVLPDLPDDVTLDSLRFDGAYTLDSGAFSQIQVGAGGIDVNAPLTVFSQQMSFNAASGPVTVAAKGKITIGQSTGLKTKVSLVAKTALELTFETFTSATSLSGAGDVVFDGGDPEFTFFTFDVDGASTAADASNTFTGTLSGPGALIIDSSSGSATGGVQALAPSDASAYTGPIAVKNGELLAEGNLGGSGLEVSAGATFGGFSESGVTRAPITVGGDVTLDPESNFAVRVDGTTAGSTYDQLAEGGQTVTLDGANLAVTSTVVPAAGTTLTIVHADSIVGTFANAAEGAVVTGSNGATFKIHYTDTDVTLVAQPSIPTTTLAPSAPRIDPGQTETFTATVAGPAGAAVPTGSVKFTEGAATLGVVQLNASGVAALSLSGFASGSHTVTAQYSGDPNFAAGAPATTTISVRDQTAATVTPSVNPTVYGTSTSFTATVAPTASEPNPTGTIQFQVDGVNLGSPVALVTGVAVSPAVTAAAGAHTITAIYGGDTKVAAATGTLAWTVQKAHLAVVADDVKAYLGKTPVLTAHYTGFVLGENATTAKVTGGPSLSTAATASSPVGSYAITVATAGSLAAANYDFPASSFASGVLTVADEPALDFDGVGRAQLAVYRPSTAQWFVQGHAAPVALFGWAGLNDIPVPGDYDGVGHAEVAVYRPSTAQWFVREPDGSTKLLGAFGWPGHDIPVPGDYDGLGHTELAVYRPSTAQWFVREPDGSTKLLGTFGWAGLNDIPVPGDYDGVGHTELAVYRPSTAQWFVQGHSGPYATFGWAGLNDIPVPGDYEGVGHAQVAVYRPSTGAWYVKADDGTTHPLGTFGATKLVDVPAGTSVASLKALGLFPGIHSLSIPSASTVSSSAVASIAVAPASVALSAFTSVSTATVSPAAGPQTPPPSHPLAQRARTAIAFNPAERAVTRPWTLAEFRTRRASTPRGPAGRR